MADRPARPPALHAPRPGGRAARERMGHGSLEATGGYVHRVSEADREAARHMGELFNRQESDTKQGE